MSKYRGRGTVKTSPVVKEFYSEVLCKQLELRRLKYNYYIVHEKYFNRDSRYVEILAEISVTQGSVSISVATNSFELREELKKYIPSYNYWITGENIE